MQHVRALSNASLNAVCHILSDVYLGSRQIRGNLRLWLSRCTTLSLDGAACLTIARICSFNFFVCSFVRACLSGMDWAAAYVMGKEQP